MWKKKLFKKRGIYLVIDNQALKGKDILPTVSGLLASGVDMFQYRDKRSSDREFLERAREIAYILKKRDVLFIINDRVDVALALNADGVHLGQEDIPVELARKMLGKNKIIGLSTHSITQMRDSINRDVDYISIGPIFPTATKPEYKATGLGMVRITLRESRHPFVAIGGIDESNIDDVIAAGARRIAVVSAILSSDDPGRAARDLIKRCVL